MRVLGAICLELAVCKTLATIYAIDAKKQTSTDYTYQIPRLFNPSRDGTFLTGEKNAINFSRS